MGWSIPFSHGHHIGAIAVGGQIIVGGDSGSDWRIFSNLIIICSSQRHVIWQIRGTVSAEAISNNRDGDNG